MPPKSKTRETASESTSTYNNGLDPALNRALENIERAHGKGAVFLLNSHDHLTIPVIPSGSLTVDIATGVGGIPRGRVTEIYGPESSGKTTLCLHVIAQAQRMGGVAAFIDMEHALDPRWAQTIGVDLDKMLVAQPESGEQALQITEDLIKSGVLAIVVIDSVAALVPRVEIEGEMGDSHVGLQARLMAQALRKLNALIKTTNVAVIFTNQIREKIGVSYGSPETQPGGRALKFYASLRIDVRKLETLKDKDVSVGNHVRARMIKNKVAPPFREAEFDIMFGEGISRAGETIDLATELGIIEKRGAFYRYSNPEAGYTDFLIGQGREAAKRTLREDGRLAFILENSVRKAFGVPQLEGEPPVKAALETPKPTLPVVPLNDEEEDDMTDAELQALLNEDDPFNDV